MGDRIAMIDPRGVPEVPERTRGGNAGVWLGQLAIFCFACLSLSARGKSADLTELSLEDLMNTTVTTVSKTEQKIGRTASAIFVITATDIARSGATNIPDLLRMVRGVDVAQINANTWAISVRGLNGPLQQRTPGTG
jgi:outer membrane receptor for ferrienterochelin and colicin